MKWSYDTEQILKKKDINKLNKNLNNNLLYLLDNN